MSIMFEKQRRGSQEETLKPTKRTSKSLWHCYPPVVPIEMMPSYAWTCLFPIVVRKRHWSSFQKNGWICMTSSTMHGCALQNRRPGGCRIQAAESEAVSKFTTSQNFNLVGLLSSRRCLCWQVLQIGTVFSTTRCAAACLQRLASSFHGWCLLHVWNSQLVGLEGFILVHRLTPRLGSFRQ
jgi:hypothetical protein